MLAASRAADLPPPLRHLRRDAPALFVMVGVISAAPTFSFIVWRREVRADAGFRPPAAEVSRLRVALYAEAALFTLIPAAMARGYGR